MAPDDTEVRASGVPGPSWVRPTPSHRRLGRPWQMLGSSPRAPGLVAGSIVLGVACVTSAVVEDRRTSEDGRVPALRPDRYLPDRHELFAARWAPVVDHAPSLSQPSVPRRTPARPVPAGLRLVPQLITQVPQDVASEETLTLIALPFEALELGDHLLLGVGAHRQHDASTASVWAVDVAQPPRLLPRRVEDDEPIAGTAQRLARFRIDGVDHAFRNFPSFDLSVAGAARPWPFDHPRGTDDVRRHVGHLRALSTVQAV